MKKYLRLFILPVLFSSGLLYAGSSAKEKEKYLSQSYVDSSIGKAFYLLTEATNMAGVGFRQKEAIDEARRIAQSLKHLAKGDPNERYVLWKASELEAQLYLEEKDLVLQQLSKGKISVNQLISRYNLEVGRVRPDFASLKRLHMQISQLDNTKANEMASSYNKRHRAISRELLFSLEKAIMSGDLKKAREELGYCLRNKTYLGISDYKYNQLEKKVEGLTLAVERKPSIEKDLTGARDDLRKNRLQTARDKIASAKHYFSGIKTYLPQNESASISSSIDLTSRLLSSKEDSLVQINLGILKTKGVQAANDYLKNTLRPSGVSRDKAAYVDNAILSISSPDTSKISREIGKMAASDDYENNGNSSALTDLLASAKRKAQQKMDSIQAIENARLRELQIENARQDSILMIAQAALRKNQDSATSLSIHLYTLLENDKADQAKKLFNRSRPFLSKYMWQDGFDILESTLNQFDASPVEKVVTVSYVSSAPSQKTQYSQEQVFEANQQKAQQEIIKLYTMLENNQITEAYNHFSKIRSPLQRYLEKEVFNMLELTLTEAYKTSSSW